MSAREERQKVVEEHRKFLADNTKDEQKRYDEAKSLTTALDEQNKALISQINDKNREVSNLNVQIVTLDSEFLSLSADLSDIKAKIYLAEKQKSELESEIEKKKEDFDKECDERNADILIRQTSLKDLSDSLDEKAREVSLAHTNAKKEQIEANNIITAAKEKLGELKDAMYDHSKTLAKYDQDRAKLNDEADQVDEDRETLKQGLIRISARENAVTEREKTLAKGEENLNDKSRQLTLKEATLNKREQKIQELIELHHLQGNK